MADGDGGLSIIVGVAVANSMKAEDRVFDLGRVLVVPKQVGLDPYVAI